MQKSGQFGHRLWYVNEAAECEGYCEIPFENTNLRERNQRRCFLPTAAADAGLLDANHPRNPSACERRLPGLPLGHGHRPLDPSSDTRTHSLYVSLHLRRSVRLLRVQSIDFCSALIFLRGRTSGAIEEGIQSQFESKAQLE